MISSSTQPLSRPHAFRLALGCALAAFALAPLAGCRIEDHNHGDSDKVRIATPFGGLSVKTNQPDIQNQIGLTLYPGAVPLPKQHDDDGSADVNLSFGGFHLGVQAADFTTPDAPAKVMAFYQKALTRYGTVIRCQHGTPIGQPTRTPDGLTCNSGNHNEHVDFSDDGNAQDTLKAGSRQRQHIVQIQAKGAGTKFGLIALDLPSGLSNDDGQKE